jgi:hypothetical protein
MENEAVPLPESALAASVDRLHLDRPTRDALKAVGIVTIGQLTAQGYLRQEAWDALGREKGKGASAAIRVLSTKCAGDVVDWHGYWQYQGVVVVPADLAADQDVAAFIASVPQILHAALVDDVRADADPERDWVVIDGRNGLVSAPKTLEELGYGALGLTRERVRQLETKAMSRVERGWDDRFHGTTYRLNPALDEVLERISAASPALGSPVFEDDLATSLGIEHKQEDRDARRLAFVLGLAGAVRIGDAGIRRPAIWANREDSTAKARVETADRIGSLLTETTPNAMTETDIVVELNRGRRTNLLSLADVRAAMPLCRVMEQLPDGRWQGRLEYLSRRGDQAYRIISIAGNPVDLDIVAREINARTLGKAVNVRNLANQLSDDDRFVPIGKSGEWGLKSEHAADAAPIIDMMIEALRRAGRPLTQDEVQAAVEARRKVAKPSVPMYLGIRPEFTRLVDGKWALSEWPEATADAAPRPVRKTPVRRKPTLADRMEAVIVPFLEAAPARQRDLIDVVDFVHETLGVIRNTVYPYLARVPGVERVEVDGHRVVRLVTPNLTPAELETGAVVTLIAVGETPRVEFKSTLRWDVRQESDNPGLQKMVTKTIAAFSNTNGGTLLIGVAPDSSVSGIELDCQVLLKKDDTCIDAFSRALAAIVSQHLGGGVAAQILTHYQRLEGKTLCVVEVPPSSEPVYLGDGKVTEFYVRNGTTSRALELRDVAPYIRGHWS